MSYNVQTEVSLLSFNTFFCCINIFAVFRDIFCTTFCASIRNNVINVPTSTIKSCMEKGDAKLRNARHKTHLLKMLPNKNCQIIKSTL